MNLKLLDAYILIDKLHSMGLDDEEEIINLLKEQCHFNTDGAVLALSSFVEEQAEIKAFLKRNKHLTEPKTPIQRGE